MADAELLHEKDLGDGLRYTEKRGTERGGLRGRRCDLWLGDESVSHLGLLPYRQRFGAVDVPVEGFGDVVTHPSHRRRGYVRRLMSRAIERATERVDALFLYGIQNLYPKFGFVTCFYECEIVLSVRNAERASSRGSHRELTLSDASAACELYNAEHATRPWSVVRDPDTPYGPRAVEDWNAGETGIALERDGRLEGYALVSEQGFGRSEDLRVREICADTAAAAERLISVIGARAWERRQRAISFREPPDSTVGRALRRLGGRVALEGAADGGGMGLIVRRRSLVERLRPELSRRAGRDAAEAVEALASGDLYADDGVLLRLLLGSHSWRDAEDLGHPVPEKHGQIARAWFPGTGPELPVPYTHSSDRY